MDPHPMNEQFHALTIKTNSTCGNLLMEFPRLQILQSTVARGVIDSPVSYNCGDSMLTDQQGGKEI